MFSVALARTLGITSTTMRRFAAVFAALAMANPSIASVDDGIAAYNAGRHDVARQHFEKAAAAGSPAGKHLLASLYYQGHGVPKDLARAVALFTEAADAGFPPSMANLALMYSVGDGVPKNEGKARSYGRRAAESGDIQSQFNLGQSYRKGAGVPKDDVQAAFWYRKAAEAGHLGAQNEYGLLFAQGHAVALDYVQAFAWIDMPASAGDSQAVKNRAQLLQILSPEDTKRAKELAVQYARQFGRRR